jgi:hypothetical protein
MRSHLEGLIEDQLMSLEVEIGRTVELMVSLTSVCSIGVRSVFLQAGE